MCFEWLLLTRRVALPGNYCPSNSSVPAPCPVGTFNSLFGQDTPASCTACAQGTYGDTHGAVSGGSCGECAAARLKRLPFPLVDSARECPSPSGGRQQCTAQPARQVPQLAPRPSRPAVRANPAPMLAYQARRYVIRAPPAPSSPCTDRQCVHRAPLAPTAPRLAPPPTTRARRARLTDPAPRLGRWSCRTVLLTPRWRVHLAGTTRPPAPAASHAHPGTRVQEG